MMDAGQAFLILTENRNRNATILSIFICLYFCQLFIFILATAAVLFGMISVCR